MSFQCLYSGGHVIQLFNSVKFRDEAGYQLFVIEDRKVK